MMKCVILGAGQGTRLRPHTDDRPKCLVELAGKPILEYEVDALRAVGVSDLHVVTGYRADQIEKRGLPTFHNPAFDSTNMVSSLMAASELFDGGHDILVSYADIVYESRVLEALLRCDSEVSLAVNTDWRALWSLRMEDPLEDAETLKVDALGDIEELGKKATSYDEVQGQYMGLILFRASAARQLPAVYGALDPAGVYDGKDLANMYMTSFLQHWIDHVGSIRSVPIEGGWLEVDTTSDLELYERLRETGELDRICRL